MDKDALEARKISSDLLVSMLAQARHQSGAPAAPARGGRPERYSRIAVWSAALTFLLILGAVVAGTHDMLAFFNIEGLLIVVGGAIAVAFMSFQSKDVIKALKAIKQIFTEQPPAARNLQRDIANIMAWARIVKAKGMRGLEEEVGYIPDPFVRYGLNMVVSNYTPEEVRAMMETAAEAYYERDITPANVLSAMAGHAPAFGMIGTLVGMVIMLYNFQEDMAGVGPGLAIAFLCTLYGVISARMVYIPAASRLMQQQDAIRFRNHLIIEGLVMLVGNKSPNYIQDRLNSFLRLEEIHDSLAADIGLRPSSPRLRAIR